MSETKLEPMELLASDDVHEGAVMRAAFSQDGKSFLTLANDRSIVQRSSLTGAVKTSSVKESDGLLTFTKVYDVGYCRDEPMILTDSTEQTVVCNPFSGRILKAGVHKAMVDGSLASCGTKALLTAAFGDIWVLDLQNEGGAGLKYSLLTDANWVRFMPDSEQVVACRQIGGTSYVMSAVRGKSPLKIRNPKTRNEGWISRLRGIGSIWQFAVAGPGRLAALTSFKLHKKIFILSTTDGHVEREFELPHDYVHCDYLVFSPDGSRLFAVLKKLNLTGSLIPPAFDYHLCEIRLSPFDQEVLLHPCPDNACFLAVSPDASQLIVGTKAGHVAIFPI